MRAMVYRRYGSPDDVLKLEDIETPVINDDQVLVRVHAAGVDPGVWHLITGLPYLVRVMGFGLAKPKHCIAGWDIAGQVEAVGSGVTRFAPGDEVLGSCHGAFAEYAGTREVNLAHKPSNVSFEQAAAVSASGLTALQALRNVNKVQPGQKVLIIGAGGGVGTYAVQIAKAMGAEVTGVCSTKKVDLVRSIGADHVVDYTLEDFTERAERYDLMVDTAGNRPLSRLRRALTPQGTLVIVGGEEGGRRLGGMSRPIWAMLISPFIGQRLRMLMARAGGDDLVELKNLIEAGKVTPVVDRTFPLAEAPAAVRYLMEGHARGKLVLTI